LVSTIHTQTAYTTECFRKHRKNTSYARAFKKYYNMYRGILQRLT